MGQVHSSKETIKYRKEYKQFACVRTPPKCNSAWFLFSQAIYNKLFIWIVKKINSVIYKKLTSNSKSAYLSVGLLDIFGFENFNTNRSGGFFLYFLFCTSSDIFFILTFYFEFSLVYVSFYKISTGITI